MTGSLRKLHVTERAPAPSEAGLQRGSVVIFDADPSGAEDASRAFSDAGYVVTLTESVAETRRVIKGKAPDVLVIDPGVPDYEGMHLIQELAPTTTISIIIVSPRGRTVHKVVGLEMGADDYLVKPVDVDELVARANALVRKVRKLTSATETVKSAGPQCFVFDGWTYDRNRRDLKNGSGQLIDLTSMETDLLEIFLKTPGAPLSRQTIVTALGKQGEVASLRHIDVLVSKLRRKIESDGIIRIKTIRGAGYMFVAQLSL